MLAALGLAYDLKVAPYTMVQYRALRTGDGTHRIFGKDAQDKHGKITYEQSPDVDYRDCIENNVRNEALENKPQSAQLTKRLVQG